MVVYLEYIYLFLMLIIVNLYYIKHVLMPYIIYIMVINTCHDIYYANTWLYIICNKCPYLYMYI